MYIYSFSLLLSLSLSLPLSLSMWIGVSVCCSSSEMVGILRCVLIKLCVSHCICACNIVLCTYCMYSVHT